MPTMKTLTIGGTTYDLEGGVTSVQGKTGAVSLTASDLAFLLPVDSASGAVASFPDGADGVPVEALSCAITPVQSGSGTPAPDNVRPISGWTEARIWCEATHDTSADPKVTVDLSGTRYGGTLDVKSGVLTVDREIVDLGSFPWYIVGDAFYCVPPQIRDRAQVNDVMCSIYKTSSATSVNNMGNYEIWNYSYAFNPKNVVIKDPRFSDASSLRTALNGVNAVIPLATPLSVQLTPAELETLLGQNNVWADCGDVSVSYRADIQKYIDKKLS